MSPCKSCKGQGQYMWVGERIPHIERKGEFTLKLLRTIKGNYTQKLKNTSLGGKSETMRNNSLQVSTKGKKLKKSKNFKIYVKK